MTVRWQCRRGMLELDIMFEQFLQHHYDHLTPQQKTQFAALLQQDDLVLYDWLIRDIPCLDIMLRDIVIHFQRPQHEI